MLPAFTQYLNSSARQAKPHRVKTDTQNLELIQSLETHMTLGGETDNSNPSRLIFSIKIPVNKDAISSSVRTPNHGVFV